jgi:hypothetical protein
VALIPATACGASGHAKPDAQFPTAAGGASPHVLFTGKSTLDSGLPPGGGNTYGPEVHKFNGVWVMYYGAQADNGVERIFRTTSSTGLTWGPGKVVVDDPDIGLEQDPSVVQVGGVLHMFYTGAKVGIIDRIYHVTSRDGIHWTKVGEALGPGPAGSWDSNLVGRPSVMVESGRWTMYYDGCTSTSSNPMEACKGSFRSVGVATSTDGVHWAKQGDQPIVPVAEAVHVSRYKGVLIMLAESPLGTRILVSRGGKHWTDHGILVQRDSEGRGHVTPYLLYDEVTGKPKRLYMGLIRDMCWCHNAMGAAELPATILDRYFTN